MNEMIMEEKDYVKQTFKFEFNRTYADGNKLTDVKIFTDTNDDQTLAEILNKFALWLGSIYGYDITKYIDVDGECLALDMPQAAQDCRGCALCE